MSNLPVLVVEDDGPLREALHATLTRAGHSVVDCADGEQALAVLARERVGLVITDVQMQPMDGYTLLRRIKARDADIPVLVMTAYGTVSSAVEAMRLGAADYIVKPFDAAQLLRKTEEYLVGRAGAAPEFIAGDPRTRELLELAARVGATDATVLISGESGTGKEVLARYLHRRSRRAQQPFIAINCAAIPESMLEATLFGYEKGAYTGAAQACPGKFEQAQGGTLLLDEISEMDLGLQAKLLRVLQEREVERLGGRKVIPLDVRVIATTNRVLREEVAARRFREDLFYRLNVFPLHLPPLRERLLDILPLARHALARHAGEKAPDIDHDAQERLLAHSWPGNVRELDNLMQRALIMHTSGIVRAADLSFEPAAEKTEAQGAAMSVSPSSLGTDLRTREQCLIIAALEAEKGSRKLAAERLGISQRTLRYKLARLREAGVAIPG